MDSASRIDRYRSFNLLPSFLLVLIVIIHNILMYTQEITQNLFIISAKIQMILLV